MSYYTHAGRPGLYLQIERTMKVTPGPNTPPPITRLPLLELLAKAHAEGLPCTPFVTADEAEQILADAQALADVRTLDDADPYWSMQEARDCDDGSRVACEVRLLVFEAETPDAARHAAAEWVRAQSRGTPDPSVVEAKQNAASVEAWTERCATQPSKGSGT